MLKKRLRSDVEESVESQDYTMKYRAFFKDIESIKFNEEYERLKGLIVLDDARMSKDKIIEVLDQICYDAKVAGFMFVRAKKEFSMYEQLDYNIWYSEKVNEAIESGDLAKSAGSEKIEAWIVTKYKDLYVEKTQKLINMKMARDAMEIFYEQFNDRKSILQTQNKSANE